MGSRESKDNWPDFSFNWDESAINGKEMIYTLCNRKVWYLNSVGPGRDIQPIPWTWGSHRVGERIKILVLQKIATSSMQVKSS